MQMEKEIYEININDIIPNRFQPRLSFDDEAMNELALSIKEHGIIQPLVLRKLGDKYEIIAGERRYKAATKAGFQVVPAVIMSLDDNKSAEVALVENVQRRDLSPLEEAKSYQKLLDRGYLNQDELAKKMGKNPSTISNKLRLLSLPQEVHDALLSGRISERHARSLLSLKTTNQQLDMLNNIINNRLTVRQADDAIKKVLETPVGEEKVIMPMESTPNISTNPILNTNPVNNSLEVLDQEQGGQYIPLQDTLPSIPNVPNVDLGIPQPEEEIIEDINPNPIIPPNIMDLLKPAEPTTIAPPQEEANKFYNVEMMESEAPNMEMDTIVKEKPIYAQEGPETSIPLIPNLKEETLEPQAITLEPTKEAVVTETGDLKGAIATIRTAAGAVEKTGFSVDTEEFDFENMYQIIIKIKKQ